MLVCGNIIGVGIFTLPGYMAEAFPDPYWLLGLWAAGGIITICAALVYAELGSKLPHSGGDYVFIREGLGSQAAFLVGWAYFAVINPGIIAAIVAGFVGTLEPLFPGLSGSLHTLYGYGWGEVIALALIGLFILLSVRGVRWASIFQCMAGGLLVAAIMIVVLFSLLSGKGDMANFHHTHLPVKLSAIGTAIACVFFAYDGFFVVAYLGDEVKRPKITIPLGILLGTGITFLIYMLLNALYLYAIPAGEMTGRSHVAVFAVERLLSTPAADCVIFIVLLAILATLNSTVMASGRIPYALARDGLLWKRLGEVHPKFRTPHISLIIQGVLASIYVSLGTFDEIVCFTASIMVLTSLMVLISAIRLRIARPEIQGEFKAFLFPIAALVFGISYTGVFAVIAASHFLHTLVGIAILLSGLVVNRLIIRARTKVTEENRFIDQ